MRFLLFLKRIARVVDILQEYPLPRSSLASVRFRQVAFMRFVFGSETTS